MMWYLGFFRHQKNENNTPQFKSQYMSFQTDASMKDWDISSSESVIQKISGTVYHDMQKCAEYDKQ